MEDGRRLHVSATPLVECRHGERDGSAGELDIHGGAVVSGRSSRSRPDVRTMWNHGFFRTIRLRDDAIAGYTYEEPSGTKHVRRSLALDVVSAAHDPGLQLPTACPPDVAEEVCEASLGLAV